MVSDKRLPLLAGQRGIWLADRANPFPGRFVNAQATNFLGEFDSNIFARAATQLVAETECLRLRIHEGADGLTQGILPPSGGIRLPILDFSAELDPNAAAETWMNAAHADPIDPAREPPFAWALLRLGSGRTIWSQSYHHVAIDSTGRNLLVARLASIYTSLATGSDPPARPSAPDFASLVARENAYLASRQSADDLAWCLSQLDDPPSVPSPSRRAVASSDVGFHRASRAIERDVMKALDGSVRRLGTTLPQLLCAAWAAFLTRISGNDEILIGLQVTGRSAATRESIATLTNVLPLRLRIPKTASFDQYAYRNRPPGAPGLAAPTPSSRAHARCPRLEPDCAGSFGDRVQLCATGSCCDPSGSRDRYTKPRTWSGQGTHARGRALRGWLGSPRPRRKPAVLLGRGGRSFGRPPDPAAQ